MIQRLLFHHYEVNINIHFIFFFQDLCFHYVWNNFLHTHVSQCVNTILYNSPVEVDGKKEHLLLAQVLLKQLSLYSVLIVRKGCEL